jgi:hypothetical protein
MATSCSLVVLVHEPDSHLGFTYVSESAARIEIPGVLRSKSSCWKHPNVSLAPNQTCQPVNIRLQSTAAGAIPSRCG